MLYTGIDVETTNDFQINLLNLLERIAEALEAQNKIGEYVDI